MQQAELRGGTHGADVRGERRGVDVHLVEQRGGVEVVVPALQVAAVDGAARLQRVEGALHGQDDRGASASIPRASSVGARRAARARRSRCCADQVHHPPVLQPHPVVEEAAQLLGEAAHGGLGALAGVGPLVVDAGADVGRRRQVSPGPARAGR